MPRSPARAGLFSFQLLTLWTAPRGSVPMAGCPGRSSNDIAFIRGEAMGRKTGRGGWSAACAFAWMVFVAVSPGDAVAATFTNPIVAADGSGGTADPSVVWRDGFYYWARSFNGN